MTAIWIPFSLRTEIILELFSLSSNWQIVGVCLKPVGSPCPPSLNLTFTASCFLQNCFTKKKTQSKILVNRLKMSDFPSILLFSKLQNIGCTGEPQRGAWHNHYTLELISFTDCHSGIPNLQASSLCFYVCNWSGSLSLPLGVQIDTKYVSKRAASRADWEQRRIGSFCSQSWKNLWSSDPFPSSLTSADVKNIITKQKGFHSELETMDFCFNIRNTIT